MLRKCCLARCHNGFPSVSLNQRILNFRPYHLSESRRTDLVSAPLRKELKDEVKAKKNVGGKRETTTTHTWPLEEWELTVGIEIHAQLNAKHKLFSGGYPHFSLDV